MIPRTPFDMTIRTPSGVEFRRMAQQARYQGVELIGSKSILYDINPTPFQREIERVITNGRGYLPIQSALDVVNSGSNFPKLNLFDVLDTGTISLYFDSSKTGEFDNNINPCGEITLKGLDVCSLPMPSNPPTLLEKLRTQQRIMGMEEFKRKNPSVWLEAA